MLADRSRQPASGTTHVSIRAVWCVVAFLALLGVLAAVGRGLFVADLVRRAEPARQQLLHALGRDEPQVVRRAAEVARFDGRFAAHPHVARLHVLAGGVLLAFAPFQFSSTVRRRYLGLHRWSGRILLLAAAGTALSGLYFGVLVPYAGWGETTAIVLIDGLFLTAVSRAFIAIRRHQVARHREWMIRAFAIGIGISTVRVVGGVLDVVLTPSGVPPQQIFVLSIWTGWALTLGAAELWIRRTRPRVAVHRHSSRSS